MVKEGIIFCIPSNPREFYMPWLVIQHKSVGGQSSTHNIVPVILITLEQKNKLLSGIILSTFSQCIKDHVVLGVPSRVATCDILNPVLDLQFSLRNKS